MIISKLVESVHNEERFHFLYKRLLEKELAGIFKSIEIQLSTDIKVDSLENDDLDTLLECGLIFSSLEDENAQASKYHDIAYRIAILLKHHYSAYAEDNKSEIYLIFSRLGRYPIASQYFEQNDLKVHNNLPIISFASANIARLMNTIEINNKPFVLTNFQKKFWDKIHTYKQLAVCAPTSAGKSFILTQYMVEQYFLAEGPFIAVYIIPTNALINEISDTIIKLSIENYHQRPVIFTTGIELDEGQGSKAIYVLTQEKLSSLIAKNDAISTAQENLIGIVSLKPLKVDLLIVDEAQIIADGERGGITKNVIEDLLENAPDTHVILGSPPVQNLSEYANFFELNELETYPETISPVAKNIIRISKIKNTNKKFDIKVDFGSESLEFPNTEIPNIDTSNISHRLASFAKALGQENPSLIYAGGKADCLKIAKKLAESQDVPLQINGSIEEFADFISEYIHPEFLLKDYLKCGVGFHFGALPLIITKQLEEKFKNRDFRVLVSTSTLLHGVNLPARNLFLCRPTKGNKEPLNEIEFWNLIGRAGRLGKDFQGNVFVIENEPETEESPLWSTNYIASAGKQIIESALDKCLRPADEGKSQLALYLDGIVNEVDGLQSDKTLENVFSQLMYHHRKGKLVQSLQRTALPLDEDEKISIIKNIERISETLSISPQILNNHRNISPVRIDSLYQRLKELSDNGDMEGRIPVHPRDNINSKAYESLCTIFQTLWKQFDVGGHHSRQRAMAAIALAWMEGKNYNALAHKYVKEADFGKDDPPTKKIYNFFTELQGTISFEYAKFMRCYIEVLALVNSEAKKKFLNSSEHIVPLHNFLEDGTYIPSQLSLMRNGLSRMSAIEIYRCLEEQLGMNAGQLEVRNIVRKNALFLKKNLHRYFYKESDKVFDLEMAIATQN